jgi:hypothetical protein
MRTNHPWSSDPKVGQRSEDFPTGVANITGEQRTSNPGVVAGGGPARYCGGGMRDQVTTDSEGRVNHTWPQVVGLTRRSSQIFASCPD